MDSSFYEDEGQRANRNTLRRAQRNRARLALTDAEKLIQFFTRLTSEVGVRQVPADIEALPCGCRRPSALELKAMGDRAAKFVQRVGLRVMRSAVGESWRCGQANCGEPLSSVAAA